MYILTIVISTMFPKALETNSFKASPTMVLLFIVFMTENRVVKVEWNCKNVFG